MSEAQLPKLGAPWREDVTTGLLVKQRVRLRKHWLIMDDEGYERHHYKHYEWIARQSFEELERREEQLAEALAAKEQAERERDAQREMANGFKAQRDAFLQRVEAAEQQRSIAQEEKMQWEANYREQEQRAEAAEQENQRLRAELEALRGKA